MRDFIFTIIAVWFLYKLYNAFFNQTQKSSAFTGNNSASTSTSTNSSASYSQKKEDLSKKLADNEGEYVSFEEVKE